MESHEFERAAREDESIAALEPCGERFLNGPQATAAKESNQHRRIGRDRAHRQSVHAGDARVRHFKIPIVHDNALLGVIYSDCWCSNEQGWTSEELEAVEAIKRVVRLALQAERTMHSPSE